MHRDYRADRFTLVHEDEPGETIILPGKRYMIGERTPNYCTDFTTAATVLGRRGYGTNTRAEAGKV